MEEEETRLFPEDVQWVVKNADMMMASGTKVTSHLSLEDLVHMVDVSVTSKYGADLT
jgi:hypothetical protein